MNEELVHKILYAYKRYTIKELIEFAESLTPKQIRWIAINHPDNYIRKKLLRKTSIHIGEKSVININFIVSDDYEELLWIGERVAISPNVTVICASGPNNSELNENEYVKNKLICKKKVLINDDAWIGANAVIMPGVTIGEKSIIGAGAVVISDVPPNTVFAGNPAKLIRYI